MTTFVLIPGAGGMAAYWHLLVPALGERGHDTVAVDLPADDPSAGFAEYADLVVKAAEGHPDPVVVAQSMGGFTAPRVCARIPVRLLVLLNAMIPNPGETAGAWWGNTGSSAAREINNVREGRPIDDPFDDLTYFFHDVPEDVRAEAMGNSRDQTEAIFAQTAGFDTWPDVPTRVLSGRDDRLFPADFQRRVAEERLGITPDVMPGGHLVALSQPDELAARLDAYVR
jgi:pimeloyl-ACP methyl ester carboxylesterase